MSIPLENIGLFTCEEWDLVDPVIMREYSKERILFALDFGICIDDLRSFTPGMKCKGTPRQREAHVSCRMGELLTDRTPLPMYWWSVDDHTDVDKLASYVSCVADGPAEAWFSRHASRSAICNELDRRFPPNAPLVERWITELGCERRKRTNEDIEPDLDFDGLANELQTAFADERSIEDLRSEADDGMPYVIETPRM